jgi:hypothetical protein
MTNETDNTEAGLRNRFFVVVAALFEAHNVSKTELQSMLNEALEKYEDDYDPTNDMPIDYMHGDAESALTSAGFGVDESYEHETPLSEQYGGE